MGGGVAISRDAPRLEEKDDSFALTVAAPGVKADNLKVTIEHDVHSSRDSIKVVGETSSSSHTHFVNWTSSLPRNADGAKATAEAIDGIVMVSIPKKQAEEMSTKTTRLITVDSVAPRTSRTAPTTRRPTTPTRSRCACRAWPPPPERHSRADAAQDHGRDEAHGGRNRSRVQGATRRRHRRRQGRRDAHRRSSHRAHAQEGCARAHHHPGQRRDRASPGGGLD